MRTDRSAREIFKRLFLDRHPKRELKAIRKKRAAFYSKNPNFFKKRPIVRFLKGFVKILTGNKYYGRKIVRTVLKAWGLDDFYVSHFTLLTEFRPDLIYLLVYLPSLERHPELESIMKPALESDLLRSKMEYFEEVNQFLNLPEYPDKYLAPFNL